ncbi:MAG: hypothetical protein EAZ73_22915 [Oscillatoriales cyanobacterium]|nr:MAG: hypothetical protein EAZ83_21455 [Oscillatoriales cyanobacterium]TAE97611.1 MAG: hypothetical protein EAZ79_10250 [Oscillatoriales cyanobacterium]TAF16977.1 MAG: hypothetical protein EAZ73_22915 [Oscillatoriales cyanobacterium]TAF28453.1 MAG: hypothetical protein EAZ69_26725 [Oscillatoriales cyanobacterium]
MGLKILSLPKFPETLTAPLFRQGLKSLANSVSRLKPTKFLVLLVGFNSHLASLSATLLKARSTKNEFSCGVGVPPARERLIENGARSQF